MNESVSTTTLSSVDATAQAIWLRQALVWMLVACFGSAPLNIVMALVWNSPAFLIAGAVAAGMGGVVLLARALVRRGRLRDAVLTIATGLLLIAIILTTTFPALTTTMTLLPLLTIVLLLPYLPSRMLVVFSVIALVAAVAIFLIGMLLPPMMVAPPRGAAIALGAFGVGVISAITLLLLWQFSARLMATIAQSSVANAALEHARHALEDEVATRTADLRAALTAVQAQSEAQNQLLDENNQQRTALREMSVPILPVSDESIVIPLIGILDSERLRMLQEQTLQAIAHSRARYVLLDITGVPMVDTHVAKGLLSVVQATRLLGAEVVLVGVRPEVAQTVVALGLDLSGMPSCQSLQAGIAYTLRHERHIAAET
jgi:rsbT co-antagonist protein RsbR